MGTNRAIYIVALSGAACFFALYPYWFSGYLFSVLLLLMPFDLALSLPGMLTRRCSLSAPDMLEQGAEGGISVTTTQSSRFPAKCIKIRLHETGDGYSVNEYYICSANGGAKRDIVIGTEHCGVTVFELERIWTVSLIGLFSLPVRVDRRVTVLILPLAIKPPRIAALPRGVVFKPKPGGGFSEDYDMRPYRPGDQIRSIHWKLSAKTDSLIVREPLVPPPHSRLVELTHWNGAHERDLIMGRLRWICEYLLSWEMPFYVRADRSAPIMEITSPSDMTDYFYYVLTGTMQSIPPPASLPAQFAWVFVVDGRDAEGESHEQ